MLEHLRHIGTNQIATFVQLICVTLRTIAFQIGGPLAQIAATTVLCDKLSDIVATLARALGTFDTKRRELALDVAKSDVGMGQNTNSVGPPQGRELFPWGSWSP
jgi:hypothetical protein